MNNEYLTQNVKEVVAVIISITYPCFIFITSSLICKFCLVKRNIRYKSRSMVYRLRTAACASCRVEWCGGVREGRLGAAVVTLEGISWGYRLPRTSSLFFMNFSYLTPCHLFWRQLSHRAVRPVMFVYNIVPERTRIILLPTSN